MKRLISLIVLLVTMVLSVNAFAEGNKVVSANDYILSFVHDEDTVYFMTNSSRQVYSVGLADQEPTNIGQGGENLVVINNNLYTLDYNTEKLRLIVQNNHEHNVDGTRLPITSSLTNGSDVWEVANMQDTPNNLYWLLYVDYSDEPILCRYNWAQGTASYRKVSYLLSYCYIDSDDLFIIQLDEKGRKVSQYNWSTDEMIFISYAPQGTNGYILHNGQLFGSESGNIYYLTDDGNFSLYAKSPVAMDSRFSGCILHNDWYVTASLSEVAFWSLSQSTHSSSSLTILGASNDSGYNEFVFAHPEVDVSVVQLEGNPDTSQLLQRMMLGELQFDVMKLNSNDFDIQRLASKGYLADLTSDIQLLQTVLSMYPSIQEMAIMGNRLYAIPCDIHVNNGIRYANNNWELAGLSDEEVPHTLIELLQFAQNGYLDVSDDFSLFSSELNLREQLLNEILLLQIAENTQAGRPIRFNTSEFKNFLHQFEDTLTVMTKASRNGPYLFSIGDTSLLSGSMLPLSLYGATEPIVPVNVSFYVVNPMSMNMEMALEYIRACVYATNDTSKLLLYPAEQEPIYSLYYLSTKTMLEMEAATLQSQIDKLTDNADKRDLQEQLSFNLSQQEELDAGSMKYSVSPDNIRYYDKNIAPYMFMRGTNLHSIYNNTGFVFESTIRQYLDNRLSIEQFVTELDRVCSMIEMEAINPNMS